MWALPLLQVGLLAAAGLVSGAWPIPDFRAPWRANLLASSSVARCLVRPSRTFTIWFGCRCWRSWWWEACRWLPLAGVAVCCLLLLVREDGGLLLFSLGLWALVRRPDQRITGALLMLVYSIWVVLVTGWIQPMVDSSLSDRF